MPEFVFLTEIFPYADRKDLSNCNESEFTTVRHIRAEDVTEACNKFVKCSGEAMLAVKPKRRHHLYAMGPGGMKLVKVFSFTVSLEEHEEAV